MSASRSIYDKRELEEAAELGIYQIGSRTRAPGQSLLGTVLEHWLGRLVHISPQFQTSR